MAVQDVQIALSGNYTATGIYSMEFVTYKNDPIVEIFFLLPPESTSMKERQRSEITETLGAGFIADFGNAFKQISVNGSLHFYYAGTPNAGRSASPAQIGGYQEFIKLRYMLMRFRDYTLTPKAKVAMPPFIGLGLAPALGLRQRVQQLVGSKKGALANQIKMIWHDYDDDNHFLVKMESFNADRNKSDPWTVSYSFDMIAYQVDPKRSSAQLQTVNVRKQPMLERIRKVQIMQSGASPQTSPDTLEIQLQDTTFPLQNTATTSNPQKILTK